MCWMPATAVSPSSIQMDHLSPVGGRQATSRANSTTPGASPSTTNSFSWPIPGTTAFRSLRGTGKSSSPLGPAAPPPKDRAVAASSTARVTSSSCPTTACWSRTRAIIGCNCLTRTAISCNRLVPWAACWDKCTNPWDWRWGQPATSSWPIRGTAAYSASPRTWFRYRSGKSAPGKGNPSLTSPTWPWTAAVASM